MSPRNVHTCLAVLGGCMLFMACVFDGSGMMPVILRMCPRYLIFLVKKWHLLLFIDGCAFHTFLKTCLMWFEVFFCCSAEYDYVIKVSDSKAEIFKKPVISSWENAAACTSAKGTLMYLYFPNGEVNAVLGIEDSSKGIWWYPTHRSNIEKFFAPFSWEKMSSTFGMGQIIFHVTLLSAHQSMTRLFPPLSLRTIMMGADQLDWLPCITFAIRSLFISSLISL